MPQKFTPVFRIVWGIGEQDHLGDMIIASIEDLDLENATYEEICTRIEELRLLRPNIGSAKNMIQLIRGLKIFLRDEMLYLATDDVSTTHDMGIFTIDKSPDGGMRMMRHKRGKNDIWDKKCKFLLISPQR